MNTQPTECDEPPDDPRDLECDYWRDEMRDRRMEEKYYGFEPNNRPQDGRVCICEDAPCCGHYES